MAHSGALLERVMFGETLLGAAATTFFMSMVSVIELRGAIPVGVAAGLPVWVAAVIAVIGNMVPIPLILLLLRQVFAWLRKMFGMGRFIDALEERARTKGKTVKKYRTVGLIILVAIPLPGTGAWTGALVADVLNMRMKHALPAIFAGVCVAGFIVSLATMGLIHLI